MEKSQLWGPLGEKHQDRGNYYEKFENFRTRLNKT